MSKKSAAAVSEETVEKTEKSETFEKLFPTVVKFQHKREEKKVKKKKIESESDTVDKEVITTDMKTSTEEADKKKVIDFNIEEFKAKNDFPASAPVEDRIKAKVDEDISKKRAELSRPTVPLTGDGGYDYIDIDEIMSASDFFRKNEVKEDEIVGTISKDADVAVKIEEAKKRDEIAISSDKVDFEDGEDLVDVECNMTDVLAQTKEEILAREIPSLSSEAVKKMSSDEKFREQCYMNNIRRVLLDAISDSAVTVAEKMELVSKLSQVDVNMNILIGKVASGGV